MLIIREAQLGIPAIIFEQEVESSMLLVLMQPCKLYIHINIAHDDDSVIRV